MKKQGKKTQREAYMNDFITQVIYWQHKFGLDNWKIIVKEDKITPDDTIQTAGAKTIADPRYHVATISVYPNTLARREVWHETIIHELIHVVMSQYDMYVDNFTDFAKIPVKNADELFFCARESGVSELTSILMRLIEWGDE